MGMIVDISRQRVPARLPSSVGEVPPRQLRIVHTERALARYKRDLALMLGTLAPAHPDVDDLATLECFASSDDPQGMINDRKLRIKTLEATIALLREIPVDTAGTADLVSRE